MQTGPRDCSNHDYCNFNYNCKKRRRIMFFRESERKSSSKSQRHHHEKLMDGDIYKIINYERSSLLLINSIDLVGDGSIRDKAAR